MITHRIWSQTRRGHPLGSVFHPFCSVVVDGEPCLAVKLKKTTVVFEVVFIEVEAWLSVVQTDPSGCPRRV